MYCKNRRSSAVRAYIINPFSFLPRIKPIIQLYNFIIRFLSVIVKIENFGCLLKYFIRLLKHVPDN